MKRRNFLKNIFAFPALFFPANFEKEPAPSKPLSLEVPIAGFQYYQGDEAWKKMKINDPLRLKREPSNPKDSQAIEVFWRNKKLGYIPRSDNPLLAQIMDQDLSVKARIIKLKKSRNPWDRVEARVEVGLWKAEA